MIQATITKINNIYAFQNIASSKSSVWLRIIKMSTEQNFKDKVYLRQSKKKAIANNENIDLITKLKKKYICKNQIYIRQKIKI